jgi:hypothetical protein
MSFLSMKNSFFSPSLHFCILFHGSMKTKDQTSTLRESVSLNVEVCSFISVFLSVFLTLRTGSTSFRYQMVCVIYLEIIIPHLYQCVV